jgi:hypothetical protein
MSIELIDFLQIYAERDPTTIAAAPPAERRTRFPAAGKLERQGNAHLAPVHGFDAAPLPWRVAWDRRELAISDVRSTPPARALTMATLPVDISK